MNKETFINDGHGLLKVLSSEILNKLLRECIDNYFPEFKERNIKIGYVISLKDFGGAKAGEWIILFLPDVMKMGHPANKFLIIHELCHFLSLHNPDKIFKKRVPKNVWKVWQKLEKQRELKCDKGENNENRIR